MLQTKNRLIEGLAEVQEQLRPHAGKVVLPAGQTVFALDQKVGSVFLVEAGIAAVAWPAPLGIDVAMIGPEGMLGSGASFGGPVALFPIVARSPLTLLQVPVQAFDDALIQSPELKARIFGFAGALMRQIAETAHANACLSVEQRLARWLSLAAGRLGGTAVLITHDQLACAIGCRRAGATVALHGLEGEKLIRSTRGKVTILDPTRLAQFASGQARSAPVC